MFIFIKNPTHPSYLSLNPRDEQGHRGEVQRRQSWFVGKKRDLCPRMATLHSPNFKDGDTDTPNPYLTSRRSYGHNFHTPSESGWDSPAVRIGQNATLALLLWGIWKVVRCCTARPSE